MQRVRSTICACLLSLAGALGQQTADRVSFEVASIKPSDPNPDNPLWVGMTADRGMVTYTNITLKDCIRGAYRVRDFQIEGPEWLEKSRYQITAKLPAGGSMEQIPEMLQGLLAERFKLTLRRDQKELPVYALGVGKAGPKLKAAEMKADEKAPTAIGPDGRPRPPMMIRLASSGIEIIAPAARVPVLVELMSRFTARPVVDMTGLDGQYQFDFTFVPEAVPDGVLGLHGVPPAFADPGQSVFDAVLPYGLRLEARKAPIEILTVTHAEQRPTEN
jgi:uncharacterized protein (TIGR03435 family)